MSDNYVSPQYGWTTYRSLHSRWIDWLMRDLDDERRAKVVAHFGWRLDLASFTLALHRWGWARVSTRISDDGADAWIGLEIPVLMDRDGSRVTEWQRCFELHHRVLGLTPEVVVALALADVEAEVEELLAAAQGDTPR